MGSFVIPTPFAAYAFEPIEAWIMSLPIYAYSFILPMSDVAQLVVFFISNVWTFLLRKFLFSFCFAKSCLFSYNSDFCVLQMTTGTSSTRCITRASSSTLDSLRPCGTG